MRWTFWQWVAITAVRLLAFIVSWAICWYLSPPQDEVDRTAWVSYLIGLLAATLCNSMVNRFSKVE